MKQSPETLLLDMLHDLCEALEYTIGEADGWCDDSRGVPVDTPEMSDARRILKGAREVLAKLK